MSSKLINLTRDITIKSNAVIAKSFWDRFSGLMLRKKIDDDCALIFYGTNSIHSFFMRFAFDLVFVDRTMKVLKVYSGLAPWRMVFCPGAYAAIEMAQGSASNTLAGEILQIQ